MPSWLTRGTGERGTDASTMLGRAECITLVSLSLCAVIRKKIDCRDINPPNNMFLANQTLKKRFTRISTILIARLHCFARDCVRTVGGQLEAQPYHGRLRACS